MFTIVVIIHVIVAISLILVVLLQSSKGDAMSGSMFGGGGGGGASFGGTRGNALSKATTALATAFMLMSIILTYLSAGSTNSLSADGSDARSVVTEQVQKELAEQDAANQSAPFDDSLSGELNLDSLISVQPGSAVDTTLPDSQ